MVKIPKRPRDPNQLAKLVVTLATEGGEAPQAPEDTKLAQGRAGGLKGGRARANTLTEEQRSDIAKKAAKARWSSKEPNQA